MVTNSGELARTSLRVSNGPAPPSGGQPGRLDNSRIQYSCRLDGTPLSVDSHVCTSFRTMTPMLSLSVGRRWASAKRGLRSPTLPQMRGRMGIFGLSGSVDFHGFGAGGDAVGDDFEFGGAGFDGGGDVEKGRDFTIGGDGHAAVVVGAAVEDVAGAVVGDAEEGIVGGGLLGLRRRRTRPGSCR